MTAAGITFQSGAWQMVVSVLTNLGLSANEATGIGLTAEAERIMARSQQLVPFELGNLAATAQVTRPYTEGNQVVVTLGYGDSSTPYALVQHERLDYQHAAGRQAKYLEQPVVYAMTSMEARMATVVRAWIERVLARQYLAGERVRPG